MPSERGQASVEWIAVIALVTISVTALARFARRDEDHALAATLAHSVICSARDGCHEDRVVGTRSGKRNEYPPPGAEAFTAPPPLPGTGWRAPGARTRPPIGRALLEWARDQVGRERAGPLPREWGGRLWREWAGRLRRELPGRLGTGAGRAWRTAWFACLVYERVRWAILHPESRSHEYEFPPSEAIRILNDCISPVDLVRDWPLLTSR
jgi:hypothetical protein